MKKILRLCPVYYPDTKFGGSVIADFEFDKFLINNGHTVRVISTTNRFKFGYEKQTKDGIEIITFGSALPCIYGISMFAQIYIFYLLIINKWPDRIFIGGVWHALIITPSFWARVRKIPYIIVPHGMLFDNLIDLKRKFWKVVLIKVALKNILCNASKIYCTNLAEKIDLEKKINRNAVVVSLPLVMELGPFLERGDSRENLEFEHRRPFVISFIGRLTAKKNIDKLIHAMSLLPIEHRAKCELRIIGPDLEGLGKAIALKTKTHACFKGPLFGKDLINAYAETDLFVLPSESENFAIGVVEAAACGAALLLTRNVGVTEYLPQNAFLECRTSASSIASSIEKIISGDVNIKDLVANARLAALQFDSRSANYETFRKDLLE
jgi:glycosyltransferase involved in cell wall biosynthesis